MAINFIIPIFVSIIICIAAAVAVYFICFYENKDNQNDLDSSFMEDSQFENPKVFDIEPITRNCNSNCATNTILGRYTLDNNLTVELYSGDVIQEKANTMVVSNRFTRKAVKAAPKAGDVGGNDTLLREIQVEDSNCNNKNVLKVLPDAIMGCLEKASAEAINEIYFPLLGKDIDVELVKAVAHIYLKQFLNFDDKEAEFPRKVCVVCSEQNGKLLQEIYYRITTIVTTKDQKKNVDELFPKQTNQ